jgi:hypothetical protein
MLRVIGAGLSRTGTHSLHLALEMLGLKSIHFDTSRLNDVLFGANAHPDFHRYDDVDAVCDLPSAFFYRELADAYPNAKLILTARDVNDWYPSIREHFRSHPIANEMRLKYRLTKKLGIESWTFREPEIDTFRRHLRRNVYGNTVPREFLYKKRFVEHNERVKAAIPPNRLLVIDITAGEGWEKLCPFLGLPISTAPFPHVRPPSFPANDRNASAAVLEDEATR